MGLFAHAASASVLLFADRDLREPQRGAQKETDVNESLETDINRNQPKSTVAKPNILLVKLETLDCHLYFSLDVRDTINV